jgi:hypothetical protein
MGEGRDDFATAVEELNLLDVGSWPFAASRHDSFSDRFGENRRQKKTRWGDGGLIDQLTDLRVPIIITNRHPSSSDADHSLQKQQSGKWQKRLEDCLLIPRFRCILSSDFSDDNPKLPQVLLNRDSPVSGVTHALGASESMCQCQCQCHLMTCVNYP